MCSTGLVRFITLTNKKQWRFCPGLHNPADLPSRGCSGEELICNRNWWRGPEFLCQPQPSWPILPTYVRTSLSTNEAGKLGRMTTINLDKVIDVTRYSSKVKLLQVTATVIKIAQFWVNKNKAPQS